MIQVRGLSKQYGEVRAVDNLSFDVKSGIVTGFLGPNGAGKSTTMRMILGLDTPTSGTALIDGVRYTSIKKPLSKVGALLDAKAVHPNRSAYDHLTWIAQSNGIPKSRVKEVLNMVGLHDVAKKKSGGFSLGMGQRLGLASALLGDPEILILDEPVNGLDPEGIRWVRELLRALAEQGRTVLVSSHLLSEMSQTADHLIVIGRGQLVEDCSTYDFIKRHSSVTVLVRSANNAQLAEVLTAAGIEYVEEPDEENRPTIYITGGKSEQIGHLAFSNNIELHLLGERQASLEEAFMETTSHAVQYHAQKGN